VDTLDWIKLAIVLTLWGWCLVEWRMRGARVPRYVHALATAMGCLGIGVMIGLGFAGLLTPGLAAMTALAPVPAVYFLWLWMFGPWLSETADAE